MRRFSYLSSLCTTALALVIWTTTTPAFAIHVVETPRSNDKDADINADQSRSLQSSRCGCSSCSSAILGRDAQGHQVGARIDWLKNTQGKSEQEACKIVCDDEFPEVCGNECNPGACNSGGGGGGSSTCKDNPSDWHDSDGPRYNCAWYSGGSNCQKYGRGYANRGKTASQACCACGGGSRDRAPSPSPSPAPIAPAPTAPTNPTSGQTASTTRYWDCSGGSCGCAYLPFGTGTDNQPAHCHSNAMFRAPSGNPYGAKFYGTAAISQALGGGDWLSEGCGKCWKVHGWSNIPGKDRYQTTLVLKGTNYCPPINSACANGKAHFDIAAPGFDVTQNSFSNTCATRESAEIDGFESCGTWMINVQNPDVGCDCSKFKDPVLRAGCENFYSLMWDNSEVIYEEVNCPSELSRLNCWEENGAKYPDNIPQFCASNV